MRTTVGRQSYHHRELENLNRGKKGKNRTKKNENWKKIIFSEHEGNQRLEGGRNCVF
jgi:hypothetical protein